MPVPLLHMQAITKDFPGVRALDNVSFEVRPGEIHALCGENGAGKSTLIKILGGVYPYGTYEGQLYINGNEQQFHTVRDAERAGIAIIHQELALIPEMTVAENIYLGKEPCQFGTIDRHRLYHEAGELLSQFGLTIPLHKPIHELGIGQQQLVEIAKALGRSLQSGNALLLVLDEPTAALTESEVEILRQILTQLREKGVACIYITHKLKEIFQIADRVTVLRDGKTVATQTIESTECTEEVLISQMVGRELTALFPKRRTKPITENGSSQEDVALQVKNLSTYPSEPPHLKDISFEVRHGEILGIAGLMGAGRTELISTIFGAYDSKWNGEIVIDGSAVQIHSPWEAIQHGMALVSEDRKRYGLLLDVDVVRNLTLASLGLASDITSYGLIDQNTAFQKSEHYVDSLQIKTTSLDVPVNHLSGGNQQKVVVARELEANPEVIIAAHPTRGLDIHAAEFVHTRLIQARNRAKAVLLVSSELDELLHLSDRIAVMYNGKIVGIVKPEETTKQELGALMLGLH